MRVPLIEEVARMGREGWKERVATWDCETEMVGVWWIWRVEVSIKFTSPSTGDG